MAYFTLKVGTNNPSIFGLKVGNNNIKFPTKIGNNNLNSFEFSPHLAKNKGPQSDLRCWQQYARLKVTRNL
jgi:hypothetical protein